MISVQEAQALVTAQIRDLGAEWVLLDEAVGRILSQDIRADRDFPPYDRVTMDGIAIASRAWAEGLRTFPVAGMQAAGHPAQRLADAGTCLEVATGAVLPEGADAIVPYEDCILGGGVAQVTAAAVQPGQNLHRQGTDSRAGDVLLRKGTRITPGVVAVLATVGAARVPVRHLPRVAVCATGDELVAVDQTPESHQIRRSNGAMLAAALREDGIAADVHHLPDDQAALQAGLAGMMSHYDVLLLSGAVSKGAFDFLPGVLRDLGMETHFHRIAQKPGKPMLFGSFAGGPVVFGFPGNPVSTLVCYTFYFRHWLRYALGMPEPSLRARLATDVTFRAPLTYHLLVRTGLQDGVLTATPGPGANSGDLVSLSTADAFITLPAGDAFFAAGTSYPLTPLAPFF